MLHDINFIGKEKIRQLQAKVSLLEELVMTFVVIKWNITKSQIAWSLTIMRVLGNQLLEYMQNRNVCAITELLFSKQKIRIVNSIVVLTT